MTKTYTIQCDQGHGSYFSAFCDGECPACADDVYPVWDKIVVTYKDMPRESEDYLMTTEECVAAMIFDSNDEASNIQEHLANELGKRITKMVLDRFRPDLFDYKEQV